GQIAFRIEALDGLEFVCQRARAGCFDCGFIHTGLIVVAYFLFYGVAFGIVRRVLLQDSADSLFAALLQFVETPPAGMIAGDWILSLPFTARVAVKIGAGIDILVEHVRGKADMPSLWRDGGRARLRWGQAREGKQEQSKYK